MATLTQRHDRGDAWYLRFVREGKRHQVKLTGGRRDREGRLAEAQARERAERDRKRLRTAGAADGATLEVLASAWLLEKEKTRRPGTLRAYRLAYGAVAGWLKARGRLPRRLQELEVDDLRGYAGERLAAGTAPRTVNLQLGAMRCLARWAVERGHLRLDPIAKWRPVAGRPRRIRRALSRAEIARLLAASPPGLGDVWLVALGTGLRASELTGLKWTDLDLDDAVLTVRNEAAKSGTGRLIPLRADVVAALRRAREASEQRRLGVEGRLRRATKAAQEAVGDEATGAAARRLAGAQRSAQAVGELVYTNRSGSPWGGGLVRRLHACCKAARLGEDVDLHTLRHTFGSHLIANGVDVKTVATLMGHKDVGTTIKVYCHLVDDGRRRAVEALDLPPAAALPDAAPASARPDGLGALSILCCPSSGEADDSAAARVELSGIREERQSDSPANS